MEFSFLLLLLGWKKQSRMKRVGARAITRKLFIRSTRRRNREEEIEKGGGGERKKVSDALNCATINLPIRKTDELFVNNGVTSIYLWAPPSCKGIYNDNHRRRRRLDRTERGKQFDPAALMQVLMIADIEREREESVVFEIISSGRRIVPSFY